MQFWFDSIRLCSCRKALLTGPICGAAAQWVSSPTDLLKVRMQLEGRRRLHGLPPRFLPFFSSITTHIAALYYSNTARDLIISFDLIPIAQIYERVAGAAKHCAGGGSARPLSRLCSQRAARVPREPRRYVPYTSPRVRTVSLIYGTVQHF